MKNPGGQGVLLTTNDTKEYKRLSNSVDDFTPCKFCKWHKEFLSADNCISDLLQMTREIVLKVAVQNVTEKQIRDGLVVSCPGFLSIYSKQ